MEKRISSTPQARQTTPLPGHEHRDVNIKLVIGLLALIFLSAFVIHGSMWGWLVGKPRGTHQRFASDWRVISPSASQGRNLPALQVNPQMDLLAYRRSQEHRLSSYAWVDAGKETIQIPIERAMQVIVEKGLPQWQAGDIRFGTASGATEADPDIDSAFLKAMSQFCEGTVELGGSAKGKASASQVSDLGKKLVQEHQKLLQEIKQLAQAKNIDVPQAPGLEDQIALLRLENARGNDFNETLSRRLLMDNAKILQELDEATNQLKEFSIKHLASNLHDKFVTDMQDIREAALASGIAEGSILSIIQLQKQAAQILANSPTEPALEGREPPGAPYDAQPTQGPGGAYPPGPPESKTNQPVARAPQAKTNVDAAFIRHLAQSTKGMQQMGELGAARSSGQVADLSRQLMKDHSKLAGKLESIARSLALDLPSEPGLLDQLSMDLLPRRHGTNFNRDLACRIISDEAALLQETGNATNYLRNPDVKRLAYESIPQLRQHLEQAKHAALDSGVSSGTVEIIVVTRLMAAGAPYPLMTNGPAASNNEEAGKSSEAEGGAGKEQGQEGGASTNAQPNSSSSPQTSNGPSPLELQEQRAQHPK